MKSSVNDYHLTTHNNQIAVAKGLADAQWYESPVSKSQMRALLVRRNGPAARDTLIWFSLLFVTAYLGVLLWPTAWAVIPFAIYGVLYASSSDSRWHEFSHGTAFKTDWLNNLFYEIASFMVMRESSVWKWSHHRHHSDTLVKGRDPEIIVQRPPRLLYLLLIFTGIPSVFSFFKSILLHCSGKLNEQEQSYIPEQEQTKVFFRARIYLAIYISVFLASIALGSLLPLMLIGLPSLYGAWLMPIYGLTQHTALVENQLDHRLNCRTVHMNVLNRFLYWNMGFHIEHHMYPMVPYYNLPKLHKLIQKDCPPAYTSLWSAWKEIIPAVLKQRSEPEYYVKRTLPSTAKSSALRKAVACFANGEENADGWIKVNAKPPRKEEIIRFDHNEQTYAIYRTHQNRLYATEGFCTHGNAHLADGLLVGNQVECPKHNGRFDIIDGSCQRLPVCIPVKVFEVKETNTGNLLLKLNSADEKTKNRAISYRVISNTHLTAHIKELTLMPVEQNVLHQAGDFIQFTIPSYDNLSYKNLDIPSTYLSQWDKAGLLNLSATNSQSCRRNYSIANAPDKPTIKTNVLTFTIRIAPPLHGTKHPPGVGSSYVFSLKPGDLIEGSKPNGDFHIWPSSSEMIYVGGGAGMAPIRAHISQLFERKSSDRKVSYWYGARTKQDIFYDQDLTEISRLNKNFDFHIALSEPSQDDSWRGKTGFIHKVLEENYLKKHPHPAEVDYYLCGPPKMMEATKRMLESYGVPEHAISCDVF
jgi:Na(+)-translocating NADH:ubiquinone oxidoreductase F subunit